MAQSTGSPQFFATLQTQPHPVQLFYSNIMADEGLILYDNDTIHTLLGYTQTIIGINGCPADFLSRVSAFVYASNIPARINAFNAKSGIIG